MIQINLLPGAPKAKRSRSVSLNLGSITAGWAARISDPFLIAAVVGVLAGAASMGGMYWYQDAAAASVAARLEAAEQDSIRFSALIKERHKTEMQRDSVETQVAMIRSIDGRRYIWPHLMDEISHALPPYTWITQVVQTGDQKAPSGQAGPAVKGDSARKNKRKTPKEVADSLEAATRVQFRIVGNTVDIQALTRFMKMLEASPFIENVQLVKSSMVIVDGKEVTEFQLDAAYQKPDSAAIRTTPLTVSVR